MKGSEIDRKVSQPVSPVAESSQDIALLCLLKRKCLCKPYWQSA